MGGNNLSIVNVISVFGGVAMFLFGMTTMTDGLEKLSSGRLESILERLTSNIFLGVFFGALVTGIIQSSAATTVMVVGFVNSGIMRLSQAVGVIMGANIGTTVTAQLLRLGDISSDNVVLSLLKPATFGPILTLVGVIMYMFTKNRVTKTVGQIIVGLGILFFGMSTMEAAVSPLKDIPQVQQLFVTFSNPIVGVAVGALITALIQSSSASVGILQVMSTTGLVTFSTAMPIIFGQNIGTCITALLSSIGARKNAKRAAMIHLYFNIIGTVFFLILLYALQYTIGLSFWNDTMNMGSIANLHLLFNVCCTALLLPLNKQLVRLVEITVRDTQEPVTSGIELTVLDERFINSPSLALDKVYSVVVQMGESVKRNFDLACSILSKYDNEKVGFFELIEDSLDDAEDQVDSYLIKLTKHELSSNESMRISEYLHCVGDFERIGDYMENLIECSKYLHDKGMSFSQMANDELDTLCAAVAEILNMTVACYSTRDKALAEKVEPLEQVIDLITDELKSRHIERLKKGACTIDLGTQFLEILTNLERISDHCSNVAVCVIFDNEMGDINSHTYLRNVHTGADEDYSRAFDEYSNKYLGQITA